MALSKHDPYNARELAQIILIGIKVTRAEERGRPTKALEKRADRIREKAQAREDARAKGHKKS